MKLIRILKILRNEAITIDYLGYNETEDIISIIKKNPNLIEKIEQIPNVFWEEAKQNGLLLYSSVIWAKRNSMNLSNGYQDDRDLNIEHINALVLEKNIRR